MDLKTLNICRRISLQPNRSLQSHSSTSVRLTKMWLLVFSLPLFSLSSPSLYLAVSLSLALSCYLALISHSGARLSKIENKSRGMGISGSDICLQDLPAKVLPSTPVSSACLTHSPPLTVQNHREVKALPLSNQPNLLP